MSASSATKEITEILLEYSIHLKCVISEVVKDFIKNYLNKDNLLEMQVILFRNFQVMLDYISSLNLKTYTLESFENIQKIVRLADIDDVMIFVNRFKEKFGTLIMFHLSQSLTSVEIFLSNESHKAIIYLVLSLMLGVILWGLISGIILTKLLR